MVSSPGSGLPSTEGTSLSPGLNKRSYGVRVWIHHSLLHSSPIKMNDFLQISSEATTAILRKSEEIQLFKWYLCLYKIMKLNHTHSLTNSLSLTHWLNHSLTNILTHSISYSLTHSSIHWLTDLITHSLTDSITHSLTNLLTNLLTHSHSLSYSLTHSFLPFAG